jgi:hypothetical protein
MASDGPVDTVSALAGAPDNRAAGGTRKRPGVVSRNNILAA